MKTRLRCTVVTLTLLAALPFAGVSAGRAAEGAELFRDEFRGRLAPGWSWIREDPAHWRAGERGLEVLVQPGNLWGRANNAKNVLVRPAPDPAGGPLEIHARVQHEPTGQWEQVNLVWFHDESHMIKLGQELVSGKLCVVMGREEGDRTRTIALVPLDAHAVELRLLVTAARIHGQYRTATRPEWREAGDCEPIARPPSPPHVSLQFYQGPAGAGRWARVEHLAIRRLAAPPVRLEEARAASGAWRAGEPSPVFLALPAPAAPAFRLELAGLAPEPPDGKADADLGGFVQRDGTYGWTWDRRTLATARPLFAGVVARAPAAGALPLPLRVAAVNTLAVELDALARLDVDRGQHTFALHLVVSDRDRPDAEPRQRVRVAFDWQGKDATGGDLDDGERRYVVAANAASTAPGAAGLDYRLAGFRGAPPRVNLKVLLADAARRLALDSARLQLWEIALGTECANGSRGRVHVRRFDLFVDGRRVATTGGP